MKARFGAYMSKSPRWLAVAVACIATLCVVSSAGWHGNMALASSSNPAQPNATCPADGQCFADVPATNTFYVFINRLYQQDLISGYPCGGPGEPCDAQNRPYYRPNDDVTRQQMAKFLDNARRLPGIRIDSASSLLPIYARTTAASGDAIQGISNGGDGVYGQTTSGPAGVSGYSNNSPGVRGDSIHDVGVQGGSVESYGVYGESSLFSGVKGVSNSPIWAGVHGEGVAMGVRAHSHAGTGVQTTSHDGDALGAYTTDGIGVRGESIFGYGVFGASTSNWAGYFQGGVHVTGPCCEASVGTFKIDHPLEPADKYLVYSALASPDMKNIYDGLVTLDAKGEAIVTLPNYFETLNGDFRYQLTAIGAPGPNLYVARKIEDNHFAIAGGTPGMEVSWQVTGIRHDPYAEQHPIVVEQDKPAGEQGMYRHPELYGQPDDKKIVGESHINP